MKNTVIYQTPDGKDATGYFINGKTYKDENGTQRIDIGSTVPTAGGTYTLTAAGSVKTPRSIGEDISAAYNSSKSHLTAARNATTSGIRAATQRTYNQINQQRENAQKQYRDSNRTAYQAYINASNPYGAAEEQRARLGLSNSGYSETSKLRTANTYQQAISQNALARDEYMRELDNAYREAKYNGDIQLSNAIAEYEKLVYQHGIDAAEAMATQNNAAYSAGIDANNAMWQRNMYEREQAIAEQERQREYEQSQWEKAYKLANAGFSNEDIAKTLGVSLSELYRIVNR